MSIERPRPDLGRPPPLSLVVAEIPQIKPGCCAPVTIVVGMGPSSTEDRYTGGVLYESIDGGASFQPIKHIGTRALMGTTVGTLAGGVSGRFVDTVNTIDILLDDAYEELSSEPIEQVAAGRTNLMLIGREVVGFQTATLVDVRTYRLSNLLRGRRNTEAEIDNHFENEMCLLLTSAGVGFIDLGLPAIGVPREYRAVPTGMAVEDVDTTVYLTPTGTSMLPFAPYAVRAKRDSSNNLTMWWERRSQVPFRLLSGVRGPEVDGEEQYEIDIIDTSIPDTLRTIRTDVGERSIEYSAADQTTDFGAPEADIEFHAYKLAPAGRGIRLEGEV